MATLYGFQTVIVMTGNSVNEDGGLGDAFTTEHAVEVSQSVWQCPVILIDNVILVL